MRFKAILVIENYAIGLFCCAIGEIEGKRNKKKKYRIIKAVVIFAVRITIKSKTLPIKRRERLADCIKGLTAGLLVNLRFGVRL